MAQQYDLLKKRLNQLPNDIRLEVLLCELLENKQLTSDNWQVLSQGIFERGHRRDLETVDLLKDEFGSVKRVQFLAYREGIFDILPKRLFYQVRDKNRLRDKVNIQKETEIQRAEEKAARTFFLPFEQEFFRQKINLEQKERAVFSGFSHPEAKRLFAHDFWNIDCENIPDEQLTDLLYALPLSFQYKGDLKQSAFLLAHLLRKEVQIELSASSLMTFDVAEMPALGEFELGSNSTLGSTFFDGMPSLNVIIKDVPKNKLSTYFNDGGQRQLLQIFYDFFLPFELDIQEDIQILEQEALFELAENSQDGILGFSTFLA